MAVLNVGLLLCAFLVVGCQVVSAGRSGRHGGGGHGHGQPPPGDDHPENSESEEEQNNNNGGNMNFTSPHNCPYEDKETHVCSTRFTVTIRQTFIVCCHQNENGEWVIGEEEDDDDDSSEEDHWGDEHGHGEEEHGGCETVCMAVRNVTITRCVIDCCEGYQRNWINGTCQNKTAAMECKNGGVLETYYGHSFCRCKPGFEGKQCDQPMCMCLNGGSCIVENGKPVCECKDEYYGENCEKHTCSMSCQNGGTCVSNGHKEICNCTAPYVGSFCEVKHHDSDECPAAQQSERTEDCLTYCHEDDDCYGDHVCCGDGCSRICKPPKTTKCTQDGLTFAPGEIYRPNDCMNCTCLTGGSMQCTAVTRCPAVTCRGYGAAPVKKPGQCCPVCPDPMEPPKINCPRYLVTIDVDENGRAKLTKTNTHVTAKDDKGKPLSVYFVPLYLEHCACPESRYRNIQTVAAYTNDSMGGESKCQLDVRLVDNIPPEYTNCPENVFMFEGNSTSWPEPFADDNVAVMRNKCTSGIKGVKLIAGTYQVTYKAWDFDGNLGICKFNVTVSKQDTPFNELPQGHREKALPSTQSDELKIGMVVGPIIGAIGLFALIVALVFCLRMKRRQGFAQSQASRYPQQNYDNNIYHLPKDVQLTPPPYSIPSNPPEYSSLKDLKEGEYAYISPPTYTESVTKDAESYINPGYETLGKKSDI